MEAMTLAKALERTTLLHQAAATVINQSVPRSNTRCELASQAGTLSLEHAVSASLLIAHSLFPSAISLLRSQFESLVRGVWFAHAASKTWLTKFDAPFASDTARPANEGPMLSEMIKHIDKSGLPRPLVDLLTGYRDAAWKVLNSYSHGGTHPLVRGYTGYPEELVVDVLRNSNGLVTLSAQLAINTSEHPQNRDPIRRMHVDFADCLPSVETKSGS